MEVSCKTFSSLSLLRPATAHLNFPLQFFATSLTTNWPVKPLAPNTTIANSLSNTLLKKNMFALCALLCAGCRQSCAMIRKPGYYCTRNATQRNLPSSFYVIFRMENTPGKYFDFYCSNHFLANSKSTQYPLNTFNSVFYPKAKDGEETGEDDFHSAPRILPRHFERGGTLGRCCFPVLLRSMGHCFQDGDHLALID